VWIDASGAAHAQATGEVRIVSLVPSLTELLCSLGLGDRLVGRTAFCRHPREIRRSVPKVGGTKDVSIDRVRALAPTHLVVNIDENRREDVEQMARFVPDVIVTHPLAPEDNLDLYRLFGGIFGRAAQAEALAEAFRRSRDALRRAVRDLPRERVLYLIWRDPWMTVGRDTYISATLRLAGWDTVPAGGDTRYPALALDEETVANVQRVLLPTEPYAFGPRDARELSALPALAGKTVTRIDGEMTSWYGSRAIDGLLYLAQRRRALAAGAHGGLSPTGC
jgi:ABC-type Fe3+-hydroxamate transport system substrate-binding protein